METTDPSTALLGELSKRHEARESKAKAEADLAAAERLRQQAAYRTLVATLAHRRKAPASAEVDALLLALRRTPAELQQDVEAARRVIAMGERSDPAGAALEAGLAQARYTRASRRVAELEKEALAAEEAAKNASVAADQRLAHVGRDEGEVLAAVPAQAREEYNRARSALEAALAAIPVRMDATWSSEIPAELEREATRLAGVAAAAWRKLLPRVGEGK